MKFLKYPLTLLYRIWFYILVLVPIIILFPFILATILSEKTYPLFFKIARLWSKIILIGMGFNYSIEGDEVFEDGKSYMLVANHTSMTDIMLMLIAVKNHPFVFVGKKELAKIPIFGFIYKRVCILVDRSNSKSRYQVFERAFINAIEPGLPIVPMVFFDNKKRFSYTFFSGTPGKMRAKIYPIIETKGKTLEDRNALKQQVRDIILQPLLEDLK